MNANTSSPVSQITPHVENKIQDFVSCLNLGDETAPTLIALLRSNFNVLEPNASAGRFAPEIGTALLVSDIGNLVFGSECGVCVDPSSPEFNNKVESNWSGTCHIRPECIFCPASPQEVGKILKIVRFLHCPFAVRSGGHNPNRGWASIGQGVLIDLVRLNKVELSEDRSTVTIGPGLRWLNVYRALEGTGVTVLGGRTPDVGVGGLILGGGLPNFASEYGMVCDNVEEFEIVLSDSTIINASRNANEDLFWALKGGGANFGIVTGYTLRTIPVEKIWYEARVYHRAQNKTILEAIAEFSLAAEKDPKASFAFSLGNVYTFVAWIYSQPVPYPAVFNMFYDIPYERHFTHPMIGTQAQFTASLEKVLGPIIKMRRAIAGVSTRPSNELYQLSYEYWRGVAEDLFSRTGATMTMGIQPVTSSAVLKGQQHGGNALNLWAESQQWFTAVVQYLDPRDDDAAHSAVSKVATFVRTTAASLGLLVPFVFMNDSNWQEDPIASYGAENVARLKRISRKYDPEQIFQNLQGDGFLLRKVEG